MILTYFKWHYGEGVKELLSIVASFFLFILHFFSMPLLLKTLFHPWRRMNEAYKRGLDPEALLSALLVNIIMRGVGFVSRISIIIIGVILLVIGGVLGLLLVIAWLFLPLLLVILFAVSISLILKSI